MADINSFQNAGSFNTETAPGAGYSTPGFGNSDWMAFFDKAAARKAEQLHYDRNRQIHMDKLAEDQQQRMTNEHEQDRADAARRAPYETLEARANKAIGQINVVPFHQADMYGHNFWTVDPREAAKANAKARMLGSPIDPFIGGTQGTRPGQFDSRSADSITAEAMGQSPPNKKQSIGGDFVSADRYVPPPPSKGGA